MKMCLFFHSFTWNIFSTYHELGMKLVTGDKMICITIPNHCPFESEALMEEKLVSLKNEWKSLIWQELTRKTYNKAIWSEISEKTSLKK